MTSPHQCGLAGVRVQGGQHVWRARGSTIHLGWPGEARTLVTSPRRQIEVSPPVRVSLQADDRIHFPITPKRGVRFSRVGHLQSTAMFSLTEPAGSARNVPAPSTDFSASVPEPRTTVREPTAAPPSYFPSCFTTKLPSRPPPEPEIRSIPTNVADPSSAWGLPPCVCGSPMCSRRQLSTLQREHGRTYESRTRRVHSTNAPADFSGQSPAISPQRPDVSARQ
jgi:hypothetical protein